MSGSDDESSNSNSVAESAMRKLDTTALSSTAIDSWSIQHVAAFLQMQGFPNKVVKNFIDEMISGVELIELDSHDLKELGLLKMGPRKKLLAKIAKLKTKGSSALDDSSTTGSALASESESESGRTVQIKAHFKKQSTDLSVSGTCTLEKLLLQLSNAFGVRVKARIVDDEGDQIPIGDDQQLYDVLVGEEKVTMQCVKDFKWKAKLGSAAPSAGSSSSSAARFADKYEMFESLLDAYVVIDEDGMIVAFNKHAEKLFGYASRKVIGKNVKMLMPDTYANKHDAYLARYARTGVKHVVDSKRTVMAKHSSGDMVAVELAVTEKERADADASHFVAVLKPLDTGDDASSSSGVESGNIVRLDHRLRNNLKALQEAAIAIDNVGTVLLFNSAAEALFGHKATAVVGGPIEVIMPSPHKENHAFYLQRYVATGEKRVMNSSRNVQALHANGSLIDINLSLSEKENKGGETVFVGLITPSVKQAHRAGKSSSALQMTRRLIHAMTVPGVVINEQGIILAFNRTAEKLLGYALIDVVGRNVKMIMNDNDAGKHDGYLAHYLSTGEEKVIGKERVVEAKHKSGKPIKVQLSVTVSEDENGKKLFTGMMHKTKHQNSEAKMKRKKSKAKRADKSEQ